MIAGIGTGIGFAVPSSMFKSVAEQLIETGHVRRPYIGIHMQEVTPEMAKGLGKSAPDKGALVAAVEPGSPADKAGAKAATSSSPSTARTSTPSKEVQRTIYAGKVGQKVDVTVWRDGQTMHLAPTTAELPGDERQASRDGELGGGARNAQKAKIGLGLSVDDADARRAHRHRPEDQGCGHHLGARRLSGAGSGRCSRAMSSSRSIASRCSRPTTRSRPWRAIAPEVTSCVSVAARQRCSSSYPPPERSRLIEGPARPRVVVRGARGLPRLPRVVVRMRAGLPRLPRVVVRALGV